MTDAKRAAVRYVEVFWVPNFKVTSQPLGGLLYLPPKPWFPYLKKHREHAAYMKCPALVESIKNDFVVLAPFDLNATLDHEGHAHTDKFGQAFFDVAVYDRSDTYVPEYPPTVSLPPRYIFFSKDDVELEVRDLPLLINESNKNFKLIGGKFNISKWHRPIDLTVEVIDKSLPITLHAEDPLFLLRFTTPDNVPVKLTRVFDDADILKNFIACASVKAFRPNLKLAKMYELAQEYISAFWDKNSKEKNDSTI
jgi:hypothetical protein